MQVLFRIPPDVPMGYVELLASPWNQANSILGVFGNSSQGLVWAGNALVDPTLRSRLAGNFAAVTGQQVVTTDTRLSALPQVTGVGTPAAAASTPFAPFAGPSTPPTARPGWVLPVALGAAVLAVLILLVAAFRGLAKNSKRPNNGSKP